MPWSGFMIPLPFSRGAMIIGEPMAIARDATREEAAHQLGAQMKLLHQRAAELVGQS